LDPDGRPALLTTQELPKSNVHEYESKKYDSIDSIVEGYTSLYPENEGSRLSLKTFLNQLLNAPDEQLEPVILEVSDDKDKRTEIHTIFRMCDFLPKVETSSNHPKYSGTINGENGGPEHVIVLSKARTKSGRDRGNREKQIDRRKPWPGGKDRKYLKFVMEKVNLDSSQALFTMARLLHISNNSLSVAGTKDKRAVTSQWVTAYQVHPQRILDLTKSMNHSCKFGNFEYCHTNLGLGDLSANSFEITLRGVTCPERQIIQAVNHTRQHGFINYFGLQRFGTGVVPTHHIGEELLCGQWKSAVEHILTPTDDTRSDVKDALLDFLKTGNALDALKSLPRKFNMQRSILEYIAREAQGGNGVGEDVYAKALLSLPKTTRNMYINAFQSFVWNNVVSERVSLYGSGQVLVGDLVIPRKIPGVQQDLGKRKRDDCIDSSDEPRVVTQEDVDCSRYSIDDVVLPLHGSTVKFPENSVATMYDKHLAKVKEQNCHHIQQFLMGSFKGAYRHFIYRPTDLEYKLQRYNEIDEEIPCFDSIPSDNDGGRFLALILKFSLPPSSYATMLVREVTKMPTDVNFAKGLEHLSISESHGRS
jgi:tRNA pseudouridine13 synthase